ncbi:xanthine dehydrogenase family protein subunit M [Veillonella caviae]|uniref:FAD binding domain-containing protein n=1 Tax=Veillonella caviae TaxID=248316 RepID=UPI0023F2F62B|nr:FAD binding domain-containing protein [Veillonella caviae]MCI6407721.1 FAD binding domain-containing protein [Veillonella caviae]MDY6225675.1 FAD binding domain-containing protein [Veillonella caviae]
MLAFLKVLQPKTVEEAFEMATKNKTAPMLAGGCWLRLGRRTWPAVIDMAGLDLRYVREEDNEFVIGAMATQGDVERFEPLKQFCGGVVVSGVKEILGVQFRNMATMGGSVASKFGFSDIIPALLAVHADVVTFKGGRMSIQDYMNYRERDILVEIRIPNNPVPVAIEALRISRGDFPYLTGSIRRDGSQYEVYIGTRPGAPQLATQASSVLSAKGVDGIAEAAQLASEELVYQKNSHASKEYRVEMVKSMVRRLVKEVAQ